MSPSPVSPVPPVDTSRYPLLAGLAVPCREHRVQENEHCPCLEQVLGQGQRSPYRTRISPWHQLPVFAQIPGLHTRFRQLEGLYLCRRFRDSGDPDNRVQVSPVCQVITDGGVQDHPWAVVLNSEPQVCRPISAWSETMTHEHVIGSLLSWTQAGPAPVDGLRALSGYWAQIPADHRYTTLAQAQWAVTPFCPDLPDGRYIVTGFTEPYPGAWPASGITDALRGDLSTLWPYLGGGGS